MKQEYKKIKGRIVDLEQKLLDQVIVKDKKKYAEITKEFNELKIIGDKIDTLEKILNQIKDNEEIAKSSKDEELSELANNELSELANTKDDLIKEIDENLKPKDPLDKKNVIIEIRAGTGGDEAGLFAADLFRMYLKYSEEKGWKTHLLSSNRTEIGGYKEVICEIKGKDVYSELKYESGVHRVQRVPETEKSGRIHTSAATVAILPEVGDVDITIDPKDLRVDTFCASGHGGQSVNTTYSAVRITHVPTDTIVSCQDERSQAQNKEKAMTILRSRLFLLEQKKQQDQIAKDRKQQVKTGDRSEKIRTYNFPQNRITDHRINKSWHNLAEILEGKIGEIIAELKKND